MPYLCTARKAGESPGSAPNLSVGLGLKAIEAGDRVFFTNNIPGWLSSLERGFGLVSPRDWLQVQTYSHARIGRHAACPT